ncbi:MAG TPA: hypothetical protein VKR81_15765 [Candidatus Binatia bacterium]|nr:hypothetical protein [Candidatus Binatia bacterium]
MAMRVMFRIALLISLVGIAQPSTAWSRLAPFDGIGGNGGAPFRIDCGEFGILVGLIGQAGVVTDQVGGLCVKIDPIAGIWVGGVYETARHGGNGGSPFRKICPVGQALAGVEGVPNYFSGATVVSALNIRCIELGIQNSWNGPVIVGTRFVSNNGDPDPYKIQALQDYCETPRKGTGHVERVWERIGLALEGRSGQFLDHLHIACGSLAQDKLGYRVAFRRSAPGAVPEGTPLQIGWRASGVKPELTPNLNYLWELYDLTHTGSASVRLPNGDNFGGFPQPTRIADPCPYAVKPCATSWFGVAGTTSVTFDALPPAVYELRLTVRPTVSPSISQVSIESHAVNRFEITPNRLAALSLTPSTIRPGGGTTATLTFEGAVSRRGITVYLSSSNPQALPTPPSVVLPGGRPSAGFTLRANAMVYSAQVQITASLLRPPGKVALKQSSAQVSGLAGQAKPQSGNASSAVAEGAPEAASPRVVTRGIGSSIAASALKSNRLATEVLNGPSNTKQAVLTIQPDLATKSLTVPKRNLQLGH